MIERVAFVILLSVALVAAYRILRHWHVRRMQPFHVTQASPTLLYFRGDHCAVCPAQERTIHQWAQQRSGDLHIERVDAERDPETAARYNVFSLPTTIWIDGDGRVRHVNYGLTDANKLDRQLASIIEKKVDAPAINRPAAIESANP
jgi:thioredoxin-like negative regulator of GroEL